MEADISTQAVGLASSADFSLMNLFLRADIIVKSVIILLIACSIYSWAVIIEKFRLFKKLMQLLKNLKKNSGIPNLQSLFITVFQPPLKIQWQLFLEMQCKTYLKKDQKLI